jgi:hypothetical protein
MMVGFCFLVFMRMGMGWDDRIWDGMDGERGDGTGALAILSYPVLFIAMGSHLGRCREMGGGFGPGW